MHSTHTTIRTGKSLCLASFSAVALMTLLTGCSNLHDVRHRWCDPEPVLIESKPLVATTPVAPQPERLTIRLAADALFQFDGSRLNQMTHDGKRALDTLIRQIQGDFSKVDSIVVIGHTDRLGSHAYNQRLSEQRAQTVKRYLQENSIAAPIEAIGKGETEPVTTDCKDGKGRKVSPALIQCLQPDRRFEVQVTGLRAQTQPPAGSATTQP